MKVLAFALLFSLSLHAEEALPESVELQSDEFETRQLAEETLLKWVRDGSQGERIETLIKRYLITEDPEERFRLAKVLFELKKDTIPQEGEGFIGISMALPGQPGFEMGGVRVTDVIKDTPAERAGLRSNDLITKISGEGIAGEDPNARLIERVKGKAPGTVIALTVERAENVLEIEVPLMNRNALKQQSAWEQRNVEVDLAKVEKLLREDFRRWLLAQRNDDEATKP